MDIILTPWRATGTFSENKYKAITEQFGINIIDDILLERFQRVTGYKPHHFLTRQLFFGHRDLEKVLDAIESGKEIFLYTGRGPSSESLHLGHLIPLQFTVWLQEVFNAVVVIQMADDEKRWVRNMEFDKVYELGFKNAKDIIALGFKPNRTFIFSNRDFSRTPAYQKVAFDIMNHTNINQIQKIFGIENNACVGQLMWPVYQSTAAFSQAFGELFEEERLCLIAYAIDQDPYFRLSRDVAPKLELSKPCSIICKFLPALENDKKMGTTEGRAIFLTDSDEEISFKIKKYAFSGGKDTLKEHREKGGNPEVDVSFLWLKYFMESDEELSRIEEEFRSGRMTSSELKNITIEVICELVRKHKERRGLVDDTIINAYYDINNIY